MEIMADYSMAYLVVVAVTVKFYSLLLYSYYYLQALEMAVAAEANISKKYLKIGIF